MKRAFFVLMSGLLSLSACASPPAQQTSTNGSSDAGKTSASASPSASASTNTSKPSDSPTGASQTPPASAQVEGKMIFADFDNSDVVSNNITSKTGTGLFTINLDGTDKKRLLEPKNDFAPVVSPDGKKVVFVSTLRDNIDTLYIINTDGSGLQKLAQRDKTLESLGLEKAFSTDGKYVISTASESSISSTAGKKTLYKFISINLADKKTQVYVNAEVGANSGPVAINPILHQQRWYYSKSTVVNNGVVSRKIYDIYSNSLDGTDEMQITQTQAYDSPQTFFVDLSKNRLIYRSYHQSTKKFSMHSINIDGSDDKAIPQTDDVTNFIATKNGDAFLATTLGGADYKSVEAKLIHSDGSLIAKADVSEYTGFKPLCFSPHNPKQIVIGGGTDKLRLFDLDKNTVNKIFPFSSSVSLSIDCF